MSDRVRVVVEDRDAVLVEAIGALSPGLMESFKKIEAEAVRLGVSRCATYFHGNDLGMSLIVRWCGFKDDEENGWGMVGVVVGSQKELIVGLVIRNFCHFWTFLFGCLACWLWFGGCNHFLGYRDWETDRKSVV